MNETKKMSKEKNYPHTRVTCPECKTPNRVVYDSFHDETYCLDCGRVILDNTLVSIPREIQRAQREEKLIRSLWHKKVKVVSR